MTDPAGEGTATPISRGLTLAMGAAAGIAVANMYYCQPMLGIMERDLAGPGGGPGMTGLVPTATQLGYAGGLFLLVPLGDLLDRRRIIIVQFVLLAVALALVAIAPSAGLVMLASLAMGACATVAQQVVPFAAALAHPTSRGKTIGTVTAGVLCGILLSRTLAGFVAVHLGWREMFWLAVPLALGAGMVMGVLLPRNHPHLTMGYGAALVSVISLWRREAGLRRATVVQALLFGSFSAFWTVLALHLQEPRFHLGADVAGLFGVVGAVGVLAAPVAGRIADRRGPALVVFIGALLTLLSWLVFGLWGALPGLVLGVVVLDFGVQSALVSNQHVVFALQPTARNRLNTVFVTGMFIGGASGSAGATLAWGLAGWAGVCGFGGALAAAALAVEGVGRLRGVADKTPVHEPAL
ncbi:MAG: MFS transporter [Janthinobacterium lividum]